MSKSFAARYALVLGFVRIGPSRLYCSRISLLQAYEPGDTELEERIDTVIRCISSCSVRASTAIEFLKVCIPPYAERCYRLLNDIRRWDVSNVDDLSQQERLMIIRDVLYQYNMVQVNLSDNVQAWTACCRMMSGSCSCGTLLHSLVFSGTSMLSAQALHTNFLECTVLYNQRNDGTSSQKKNRELSLQIAILYPLVLKRWIEFRQRNAEDSDQISAKLLSSFSKNIPLSLNEAIQCILGETIVEDERLLEFVSPLKCLSSENGGYRNSLACMIMDSSLLDCLYDIDQNHIAKAAEEALQFCLERIAHSSSNARKVGTDIVSSVVGLEQTPKGESIQEFIGLNESLITLATACIDLGEPANGKDTLLRWIDYAQRCISLSSEFGIQPAFSFLEDRSLQEECLTRVIGELCNKPENRGCDKSPDFALCHQQTGRLKRVLSLFGLSVPSIVSKYCGDAKNKVGQIPFAHTAARLDESILLTQQGRSNSTVFKNLCNVAKNMSVTSNSSVCKEYIPSAGTEITKQSLAACPDDDISGVFEVWQQVETSEWVWKNSDLDESNQCKSLSSNDPFGSVITAWRNELRQRDDTRGSSSLSRKFFGSETMEVQEDDDSSQSIDLDVYRKFRSHFTDTTSLLERDSPETEHLISWILSSDKISRDTTIQCLLDRGARQLSLRTLMIKMPATESRREDSTNIFGLLSSAVFDSSLMDLDLCSAYLLHQSAELALDAVRNLLPQVICKPESLVSVANVGSRVALAFGDKELTDICQQLQEHYCWYKVLRGKMCDSDVIRLGTGGDRSVTSIESAMEEVKTWGQEHFVRVVGEFCTINTIAAYCSCYKIPPQSALTRVLEWVLLDCRFQDYFHKWKPLIKDVLEQLERSVTFDVLKNALYTINPYDYERILFVSNVLKEHFHSCECDRIVQLTLALRNYRRNAQPLAEEVSQPLWRSRAGTYFVSDVQLWDPKNLSLIDGRARERLPIHSLLGEESLKILRREICPSTIPKLLPLTAPLHLHEDFFYEELCKSMTKKFVVQRICNVAAFLGAQFKDLCLDNMTGLGANNSRSYHLREVQLYMVHPNSEIVAGVPRTTTRGSFSLRDSVEPQFQHLQKYLLDQMMCCGGRDEALKPIHLDDIVEQLEQIYDSTRQLQTLEWIQDALPFDRKDLQQPMWATVYSSIFSPELEVHCKMRSEKGDDTLVTASIPTLMQSGLIRNLRKAVSGVGQLFELPTLSLVSVKDNEEYSYVLTGSDKHLQGFDVSFYDPQSSFLNRLDTIKRNSELSWTNALHSLSQGEKCAESLDAGSQWRHYYGSFLKSSEEAGIATGKLCFLALNYEVHLSSDQNDKENEMHTEECSKPKEFPTQTLSRNRFPAMIRNALLRIKLIHVGALEHSVDVCLSHEVDGEQLVRSMLNESADAALRTLVHTSISSELQLECDESFQMDSSSIAIKLFQLCQEILKRSNRSFSNLKERLVGEWLKQEPSTENRGSECGQLSSLLYPCDSERMQEFARVTGEKVLFLILASDALQSTGKVEENDQLSSAVSATNWLINAVLADDTSLRKTASYFKFMACHVVIELSRLHGAAYQICRERREQFRKTCGAEADELRKLSLCKHSIEFQLSSVIALRDLHWFIYLFKEAGIDKGLDGAVSNSKVSFIKGIWRHHKDDIRVAVLSASFSTCFNLPLASIVRQTYNSLVDQKHFRSAIWLGEQLIENVQNQAWMETYEGFAEGTTKLTEQSVKVLLEFHSATHQICVPGDDHLAGGNSGSGLVPYSSYSSKQFEFLESVNWIFSRICFLVRETKSQFSTKQLRRIANAFQRCEPILTPQYMFSLSLLTKEDVPVIRTGNSGSLAQLGRFLSVAYPRQFGTLDVAFVPDNLLEEETVVNLANSTCWPAFVLCMCYFGHLERMQWILIQRSCWHCVIGTVNLVASHFELSSHANQRLQELETTKVDHGGMEKTAWTSSDQPAPIDWIASMPAHFRKLEAWSHGASQPVWQHVNSFLYHLSQEVPGCANPEE
eukprot:gb/GECG01007440.1/.p1 GENE.gb/GECG01007440.1/~~gb/GECG01007440.1/.p1  ORF type:complete len:2010 (+),score=217.19 gb/GECG01007440.1/:1-6030(+)